MCCGVCVEYGADPKTRLTSLQFVHVSSLFSEEQKGYFHTITHRARKNEMEKKNVFKRGKEDALLLVV